MKKVFMVMFILCIAFSTFADPATQVGHVTVDDANNLNGANATLPISFNNPGFCSVTVGFSNKSVNDFSPLQGEDIVYSATLIRDSGNRTASYGTTAETPLYVFWQIISSTKVNLTIEPLKTSENTTGALACGTGFLHWYVAPFTNQEASYFNTSGGTLLGAIQTDHNPTTSAVGKAGSTQIIIKTADLYSVPAGEYSGTLVLNISTT